MTCDFSSYQLSDDNNDGNRFPLEIIMVHVCPFLDRSTWNKVSMTCRDLYIGLTFSGRVDPPWPNQAHISLDRKNVKSLSFAPDGKTMAFVTTDNKNTIHVLDQKWGLRSRLLHPKSKKINPIHQISFAPKPCEVYDQDQFQNYNEQEHNLVITSPFEKIGYLSVAVQELIKASQVSKYASKNGGGDYMPSYCLMGQEDNQELTLSSSSLSLQNDSIDPMLAMFDRQGMEQMELGLCAWSPDGSYLATAYYDNTIRLSQGDTAINVYHCRTIGSFYGLQFSSHGKYLGIAIQGSIELWQNWKTSSAHLTPFRTNQRNEYAFSFCFSPNEQYLAMGTSMGNIYVWDLQSRRKQLLLQVLSISTLTNNKNNHHLDDDTSSSSVAINALAFDPNNDNILLSGSHDGHIRQWNNIVNDPNNVYCVKEMQVSAPVRSLSFAPDKRTLVSAIERAGIWFWDYAQWQSSSLKVAESPPSSLFMKV